MRRFLIRIALLAALVPSGAQACLFARDAQPRDWLDWASVLLAAQVIGIEQQSAMDVVRLEVREAFKGPPAAKTATLQVPARMWAGCRLERPAVGAEVLVAINPNGDALLVPLTPQYAERLRATTPSGPAPTSK